MMKKLGFVFMLVMAASIFYGCEKQKEIQIFRMGADTGFAPFSYKDEQGVFRGYDIELATEVAKRNNWKIVIVPLDWSQKDKHLEKGEIDCIWSGFTINGRENKYTWTAPYAINNQIIMVKKTSGINTLANLAGKKLATKQATSGMAALNHEKNKGFVSSLGELVLCKSHDDAFDKFTSGEADAMLADQGYALNKHLDHESEYAILDEIIAKELIGIAFKLGNTQKAAIVQNTLKEMVADGTVERLSKNWFGGQDTCAIIP